MEHGGNAEVLGASQDQIDLTEFRRGKKELAFIDKRFESIQHDSEFLIKLFVAILETSLSAQ